MTAPVSGKDKKIRLLSRQMQLPNKQTARLAYVVHPGAVLVIPFLDAHTVILLRQYRPVIARYLYELPAGTLRQGEMPRTCAKREVAEETGFAAGRITMMGILYPVPGYSTEKITVFKAEKLHRTTNACEADEIISPRRATKQDIQRLFHAKKIIDAKTISAFAMCGWL